MGFPDLSSAPYPVTGSPYPPGSSNPNPAYSPNFIPTLWSGKLIEKFYEATVLAAIANTDYAGEIKNQGDRVVIRQKPTLTINDYEANMDLAVERPSSDVVELLIDKGKYFSAIVDDVMETQADLDLLGMWADDASEQMKISIDTGVLAGLAPQYYTNGTIPSDWNAASSGNQGATAGRVSANIGLGTTGAPIALTNVNIIDTILDCGQALDEALIPEQGRWLIVTPWMANRIKKSELRDASLTGDGQTMMRNGRLGMIDRFTLYSSNLSPTNGTWTEMHFGHSHGLTFASQLTKMETIRAERTFGTIMRGLQVYGSKVTDPRALGMAVVSQG